MNRTSAALLTLALALPATAMAQSGPSFSLIAGYDTSVSGDVHKGAIAPIADLGPLNPDLAGVSAELRIGARSYDKIYGKATNLGVEMAWPMGNSDEVFGQLPREVDDRPDRRRLGVAHLRHVTVVAGHRLGGILPRGRLGQQPRVGLIAKPEGVLADEATGIRVVGRDGRGAAENLRPLFVGRWRP